MNWFTAWEIVLALCFVSAGALPYPWNVWDAAGVAAWVIATVTFVAVVYTRDWLARRRDSRVTWL